MTHVTRSFAPYVVASVFLVFTGCGFTVRETASLPKVEFPPPVTATGTDGSTGPTLIVSPNGTIVKYPGVRTSAPVPKRYYGM